MATAQSTSTLIDAVNRVLTAIGERQVTSLASPVAVLASNAIKSTVYELSTVHDWTWTRDKIPTTLWTAQTATLQDITKIHGVEAGSTSTGFRSVMFLQKDVFNSIPITSYSTTTNPLAIPSYWTIDSYNEVQVTPYPSDSTAQAKVLFDVTRVMIPPSVATDTFPIPEHYMDLVIYKACGAMALMHLADTESQAQFIGMWERFAQRVRERDGNRAPSQLTMHRRGRGNTF